MQSFFPGLFFNVYVKSLNPKKRKATHHRAQTPLIGDLNPKKPNSRPPISKLQSQNHHKWAKKREKKSKDKPWEKNIHQKEKESTYQGNIQGNSDDDHKLQAFGNLYK